MEREIKGGFRTINPHTEKEIATYKAANFSEDEITINFSNYKSIIIINSNGILNRVGNTNAFKLITKEDNLSIFKKIED